MFEFEARSAVADRKVKLVFLDLRLDRDRRSLTLGREPMLDGVLDDGLKNHEGDERIEALRGDLQIHLESIVESDLLNGEITIEKIELLGKRHRLRMGFVYHEPEQIAEPAQRLDHCVVVAAEC